MINALTAATELQTDDQIALYSQQTGNDSRAALSTLLAWLQANLTLTGNDLAQQHAAPSATGFSISVLVGNTWLVIILAAGYAAGTIVLPVNSANGEEVLVNCTQSVTTLTTNGNGNTVTGAPTTLAANAFFRLRFDAVLDAWYRVG